MRNTPRSRRALLLGASLLALSTANIAVAQEAEDQDTEDQVDDSVEEIVVSGFKASLQSAQSIKENSDTVVDAITAEDIGALADRSVAEALQRIPGVNVGRFQKTSDPDRFSVEGADVVIRGLPFVRSELNGRDVFSATGGRVLSFNDVSPELLGGVQVFKANSADMIDGAISGTVNLITRKPVDELGFRVAGTVEANYGDLAKDLVPGFSVLAAQTWETSKGRFGLQAGFSMSELRTESNASQITDPCYREATLDGACLRVRSVGSAGVGDDTGFDSTNFPPEGAVIVPKGAGVRTTGYDRDRNAFSAVAQFESAEKNLLVTAEYLRAEADLFVDEYAMLALVNDDNLFPVELPGQPWNFDSNGVFQSGVLSQQAWHGFNNCVAGTLDVPTGEFPAVSDTQPCDMQDGIPTEMLRFQRDDNAVTQDFSLDIQWSPTDRIDLNFEVQHVDSNRTEDGVIASMAGRSDIFIDMGNGQTPNIQFLAPTGADTAAHFSNPDRVYNWFAIDSFIDNEGDMTTFRGDIDYNFDDDSFIKRVKFGARWSDRNRITRDNAFGNWGNLSNAWTWAGAAPNNPVYASNAAAQGINNLRSPFEDFQRGQTSIPVPGGSAFFFGGDNMVQDYRDGIFQDQAFAIIDAFGARIAETWGPVADRELNVGDTIYTTGELSGVGEKTQAFYARVDFGNNIIPGAGDGVAISGNVGLRYVETTIQSEGEIQFPLPEFAPDAATSCTLPPGIPNAQLPPFCFLSEARQAEFLEGFTGELIDDSADINFSHWLPSLNVKFGITADFQVRVAVSKAISRPDLGSFSTGGVIGSNLGALQAEGTLETGTLWALRTGNRLLRPVSAWNYDLTAEWYFDRVGSLTASLFWKDFNGLITDSSTLRTFVSDSGVEAEVRIDGPTNQDKATIKGLEVGYQQTFDFLPGFLQYTGIQATYTYVDPGDLSAPENDVRRSAFADGLGFPGISEHTYNLTGFYEDAKFSFRLAYNWRSDYMLTARDDIFPFSPIFGESTGQLDGSIFYNVTDNIKVGIQAVNLLDEVTRTTQLIDFDGTRLPRTAFRNDRRFTFLVRFNF